MSDFEKELFAYINDAMIKEFDLKDNYDIRKDAQHKNTFVNYLLLSKNTKKMLYQIYSMVIVIEVGEYFQRDITDEERETIMDILDIDDGIMQEYLDSLDAPCSLYNLMIINEAFRPTLMILHRLVYYILSGTSRKKDYKANAKEKEENLKALNDVIKYMCDIGVLDFDAIPKYDCRPFVFEFIKEGFITGRKADLYHERQVKVYKNIFSELMASRTLRLTKKPYEIESLAKQKTTEQLEREGLFFKSFSKRKRDLLDDFIKVHWGEYVINQFLILLDRGKTEPPIEGLYGLDFWETIRENAPIPFVSYMVDKPCFLPPHIMVQKFEYCEDKELFEIIAEPDETLYCTSKKDQVFDPVRLSSIISDAALCPFKETVVYNRKFVDMLCEFDMERDKAEKIGTFVEGMRYAVLSPRSIFDQEDLFSGTSMKTLEDIEKKNAELIERKRAETSLNTQIRHLREENKSLKQDSVSMKNRLEEEIERLRKENEELHQKVLERDEMLDAYEQDSSETIPEKEVQFPHIFEKNIVIFGGHDTFRKAIPQYLPNVKVVDINGRIDWNVLKNADHVFLQINCMAHSHFYGAVNACKISNTPYTYLNNASAKLCSTIIVNVVEETGTQA